jgi:SAM-dependent methyltransferase
MEDIYTLRSEEFAHAYNSIDPFELYKEWVHLIPQTPGLVLDVGAGSGRDANWLANQGHEVYAIEPSSGMRQVGQKVFPNPKIQWIDDSLPNLKKVFNLNLKFNMILLNAVWMHIHEKNREKSIQTLSSLLAPHGILILTLRKGFCNDDRTMYKVEPEEVNQLAKQNKLKTILQFKNNDKMKRPDISWITIILENVVR